MSRELACPACGEAHDLTGQRRDEGIHITCGTCGSSWRRDTRRACATCGGDQLHERAQPLTQYSRGTQLSITGWHQVLLCASCDALMLGRSSQGKPIPPGYRPAATTPRGPDGDSGGGTEILPRVTGHGSIR